jgi:flagellar assembly factor FliW
MSAPEAAAPAADVPVLEFVEHPPGLPALARCVLVALDDDGVVFELRPAGEDDGTRLLVVAPGPFFPDYAPVIDDEAVAALALGSADDALVLLVVTGGGETLTANLLAPMVVNRATRRAAQVVLADTDLPLRAPLGT